MKPGGQEGSGGVRGAMATRTHSPMRPEARARGAAALAATSGAAATAGTTPVATAREESYIKMAERATLFAPVQEKEGATGGGITGD